MKLLVNGQTVEATRMGVVKSEERENEYLLENGTVIRCKAVAVGIYRVEGQQGQDGRPVYQLQSQVIVTAEHDG